MGASTAVVEPLMPIGSIGTLPSRSTLRPIDFTKGLCSPCCLRELCLPCNLIREDIKHFDQLVHTRRCFKRDQTLYSAGDHFQSLYAIHKGSFKTYVLSEDGREQITGFHMAAEIVGMDGIETNEYSLYVVALEESEVCIIPYARLEELAIQLPVLQRQILKIMSRAITSDQYRLLLLGSMQAEERIATFLINLSQRFAKLGHRANQFQLQMKRAEIGSYLGLSIETVSRVFSRLQRKKLINVHQQQVQIIDALGLQQVAGY